MEFRWLQHRLYINKDAFFHTFFLLLFVFFTSELPSAGSSSSLPVAPVRHEKTILLYSELTDIMLGVISGGCKLVSTQGVVSDLWGFVMRARGQSFFLRDAETSSGHMVQTRSDFTRLSTN